MTAGGIQKEKAFELKYGNTPFDIQSKDVLPFLFFSLFSKYRIAENVHTIEENGILLRKRGESMKDQFFCRDLVWLMLVSILFATLVAAGLSLAANFYFQQTLTQLVGDYGEYDLLIQVREEMQTDGQAQLAEIIASMPGAKLKTAPAIAGKANFFVALAKEQKNKENYENINRLFAGVPGITGISIITEPRLSIRGVPAGAVDMLMNKLENLDGVSFVYRTGGSIGVVLSGVDQIAAVTAGVEQELRSFQVLEVSFPLGAEPENPVWTAERIVGEIARELKPQTIEYASLEEKADEMAHVVSTMKEMRKFFLAYATKISIQPLESASLHKGDILLVQGNASEPPATGQAVSRSHILIEIQDLLGDGGAVGIISQGDVTDLQNHQAFFTEDGTVGTVAGTIGVQSPRARLTGALEKTADFVEKVPMIAAEADQAGDTALEALEQYRKNAKAMEGTFDQMNQAVDMIGAATKRMRAVDAFNLRSQLDGSLQSMQSLIKALHLIQIFNPDVSHAIQSLETTRAKLTDFKQLVSGLDEMTAEAEKAQKLLGGLSSGGRKISNALAAVDNAGTRQSLNAMKKNLDRIYEADLKRAAQEIRYMAEAAPQMKDEELYTTIRLLDRIVQGQFPIGQRLQFLVDRQIAPEPLETVVKQAVGYENIGVFHADLGVIEPNIYLQVYQVLGEVQAVLAGLAAVVLTLILLALDHTAVISVLKAYRKRSRRSVFFFKREENIYGMAVGLILLSTVFFFSGGGIPYLPWYAIPIAGALLGLFIARYSEKITPVSEEEILAGESLGMTFAEIMREIVIPSARPGLLQRLNRKYLLFKS